MAFDINKLCRPAYIYLVIASIIAIVSALLNINNLNLIALSSQFLCIIICTFILYSICSVSEPIAWVFTITFVLLVLSGIIVALQSRNN